MEALQAGEDELAVLELLQKRLVSRRRRVVSSSFSQTKRHALQQRIADLTQEYEAINQQLRGL